MPVRKFKAQTDISYSDVDRAGIFYVWLQRVAHVVAGSEVRLCNEDVSGITGS